MHRPTRLQWIVLWSGAVWIVGSLVLLDDYASRAVIGGTVVTALLYWQLSSHSGQMSPRHAVRPQHSSEPHSRAVNVAEFLGDLLAVQIASDRFGLKEADVGRVTASLSPELQKPAAVWIDMYAGWLFRLAVREKYGEALTEAMWNAARVHLDACKSIARDPTERVRELEVGFDCLDRAASRIGRKVGEFVSEPHSDIAEVELPFAMLAAWSLLALSPESPYFGEREFPNSIDLQLAECLEAVQAAVLPTVQLLVEFDGPVSGTPDEAVRAFADAAARADAAAGGALRRPN